MSAIGIDIGSSSIKGAVLDFDAGRLGRVATAPFPDPVPGLEAGSFEIDVDTVVHAVRSVIETLASSDAAIDRVLLCGQMAGLVLLSPRGELLSRYVSWRDQRVLAPARDRPERSILDDVREILGGAILGELGAELEAGSATSILHALACAGRLPETRFFPLSICEAVVARLTRAEPTVELTQAIGTIDVARGVWHEEAFARLGARDLLWPRLVDFREVVGELRVAGRSLACHAPVGDQQCALAGIALGPDELSVNVSTGSQVSRISSTFTHGSYKSRRYFDGLFLDTITHIPAGRALNVLVDLLVELPTLAGRPIDDPWVHIARAIEEAQDSDLEVDLAFFAGPMGKRGSISNIGVDNFGVGTIFRASFETMAKNYAICAARLDPERRSTRLALSGGLVRRFPRLARSIAARLALPDRIAITEEETLRGLLTIGLVASGRTASVLEAQAELETAFPRSLEPRGERG
jgi:sugar (pentulose or hexulose) kinase